VRNERKKGGLLKSMLFSKSWIHVPINGLIRFLSMVKKMNRSVISWAARHSHFVLWLFPPLGIND
jgi:hypothetical protein